MLTVKLYTYAGVYIKDLTAAEGISIRAARNQDIRRSCSFTLAVTSQDLADARIPGRRVKVYDSGSTLRFSGYIDSVRPAIADGAWMEVTARDKAKVLKLARFAADVTYDYSGSTTDAARTLILAVGSSELQVSDAIQGQGKVYGRRLQATARGIIADVEPDSESGSILTGDYSIDYNADGLTLLTLTQYIDLLASESINGITVTTLGTALAYYSTDGTVWVVYTTGSGIDEYAKLVLHMDGVDDGTTFADECGKTVTRVGTPVTKTAVKKFGTASAYLNGISDCLTVPDSADFDFGTGDFTLEFWGYNLAGDNGTVFQLADAAFGPAIGYVSGSNLVCYISSDGSSWGIANGQSMGALPGAAWVHYALVRSGSNFYTFRNGVQQATWSSSANIYMPVGDCIIGRYRATGGASLYYMGGYIDEVRISKGIARWTSNFAPLTSPYAPSGSGTVTARYIKVVTTDTDGPIAVGVEVTAAAASPASNVMTDNAAAWRPRSTDLERELTVYNSSSANLVNYLIVKAGVSDLDRETAYIVDGYALISGTWTKIITDALLVGGYNELLFDAAYEVGVNASEFKLCFELKNAPVAVRYVEARYTSSLSIVYWLIRAVLTAAGETDFSLLTMTHQLPQGNAITFEAGEEKLKACIELAESAGYEFSYDEQDRPVLRPVRWADPMDADIPEYDAALEWAPEYSDASLYNQVLAVYEAADASLSSVATNDRGDSGTSTVNIGTRTSPVLRYPLANTQAKLDLIAQEQLARYSKAETRATLRLPWAVGDVLPEPGGIVRVVEALTGTNELMRVVSVELREANEVTLQLEVETL